MKAFAQLSSTCRTLPHGKTQIHTERLGGGVGERVAQRPGPRSRLASVCGHLGLLASGQQNTPGWPTPGSRGKEAAGMPGAGGCSWSLGALPEHKVPSYRKKGCSVLAGCGVALGAGQGSVPPSEGRPPAHRADTPQKADVVKHRTQAPAGAVYCQGPRRVAWSLAGLLPGTVDWAVCWEWGQQRLKSDFIEG